MAEISSADPSTPSFNLSPNPNFLDFDFDLDCIDWDFSVDDLLLPEITNHSSHPSHTSNGGSPQESGSINPRRSKSRRTEDSSSCEEEEKKKKARLMRNRESAQLSRQRKKQYVEELQEKVRAMSNTIAELNDQISLIVAENSSLKQQLGGFSPAVYHPYLVFSKQGSSVPLVPIPKLKSRQVSSFQMTEKTERKKRGSKIRNVASITFLGFLCLVLVFGGFVGRVDDGYEESRDFGAGRVKNGVFGNPNGMVLSVSGNDGRNSRMEVDKNLQNCSESLPALLYVPRNGKHVEINGNLIINSAVASEKAVALVKSRDQPKKAPIYVKYQRALASDSEDVFLDSSQDGFLQQWFREGMAGKNSGFGC